MDKVRFALAIFKGIDSPNLNILFGRDIASTSNPPSSKIGNLREFLNRKIEKFHVFTVIANS